MTEEAQDGKGSVVPGDRAGLDWDRVLAGIASSLAGANGRALLKPDYLAEAMSKTREMLVMLEVASWEDHVEDMLRPQLEGLLVTLQAASTETHL